MAFKDKMEFKGYYQGDFICKMLKNPFSNETFAREVMDPLRPKRSIWLPKVLGKCKTVNVV